MASRMRDAVGVLLVQPGRVEVADQRARAEEGGLVALAFLFGEADHLEAEGQAPALARAARARRPSARRCPGGRRTCRRCARCRSASRSAASWRRGVGAVVAAHHVAHGIDLHLVEAAVAHVLRDLRGAGAVRIGEVGDGELALLGIARVAVLRQRSPASPRPGCRASGSTPNLSFRRISAMRWMLRSASASSKSGWLSRRRSKVSMICCARAGPVPRGPRTARMKGKPNFAL